MSEAFSAFVCKSPGMVNGTTVVEEHNTVNGQHYFKAVQPIGSLFGQEVEGDLTAYGATREIALQRLDDERQQLYQSLWA